MGIPKTDLTGKTIGELFIDHYIGKGKWHCICSCGKEKDIDTGKLANGLVTSCGHDKNHSTRFVDITNQKFGDWTVIKYLGNQTWLCKCSCGIERPVDGRTLRNGFSTGCGHARKQLSIDITGQKFGEWTVLEYLGHQIYKCQCSCGKIVNKNGRELRRGNSRSCGHAKSDLFKQTMLQKYGDISHWKINNPRNSEQLDALKSRENLYNFIKNYEHTPTVGELSRDLSLIDCMVLRYIHNYKLDDFVTLYPNKSTYELDIINYIKSIYSGRILTNNNNIIPGLELDILIPDKGIAIEFNGTYWHSSIYKSVKYHYNKSLECAKKNIRLIHIFEYEWVDEDKQIKIKQLLKNQLSNDNIKIYARDCEVLEIPFDVCRDFTNKFHIQGYSKSEIQYGLYYKDRLLGVATFGKPRFNTNYTYELIRLCWDADYQVVGGSEKLVKSFISKYKPNSIISYCNLAKFSGDVYKRLGFKLINITNPNYVWVSNHNKEVLSRYQTMKKDLIAKGLGTEEDTEDSIMENCGFFKIYDCGNLVFVWEA